MLRKKTTKLKSKPNNIDSRRRRSLSNIPANKARPVSSDPHSLRYDRLRDCLILPRPTDRKSRLPSLEKFLAGRSSLWSLANAVSRLEKAKRNISDKENQSFSGAWFMNDKKQLLHEKNESRRNEVPLPDSLCVHLKICRKQIVHLLDEEYETFRYDDLPHVFIFFKTSSKQKNAAMPLEVRAARATLNNATVILFVGGHDIGAGIKAGSGLGSLYLSTGKEMSGRAQLLLRVKQREGQGKRRRRMNGTIENVW